MLTRQNIFVACTREGGNQAHRHDRRRRGRSAASTASACSSRASPQSLISMHMDKWGVHGRGMALYSIAVNAEICTHCRIGFGPRVGIRHVETDLDKRRREDRPVQLSRRSSAPKREPWRCAARRTSCALRANSPLNLGPRVHRVSSDPSTDVAATLYAFGLRVAFRGSRALSGENESDELPDVQAPGPRHVRACRAFRQTAESLGLLLSERSARRILDGANRCPCPHCWQKSKSMDCKRPTRSKRKGPNPKERPPTLRPNMQKD